MGPHLLALAKLKLAAIFGHASHSSINLLLCPFILKFALHNRMPRIYGDITTSFTLFCFRLNQILFQDPAMDGGRRRWERALRLLQERVAGAAQISAAQAQTNEASLLEATMAAL